MRIVVAAFGLVALGTVAVGWLESPDHITQAEAVTVAEHAFAAAGVRGATVDPRPSAGLYDPPDGGAKVPVWRTSAKVTGGTIKLWLTQTDAESVFLDDRAPDGSSQLLTDTQFRKLADHYENPAVSRQIRRNLVLTLAAALIVLLAVRLAVEMGRQSAARRARLADAEALPPGFGAPEMDALGEWDLERDWIPKRIGVHPTIRRQALRATKETS